MAQSTANLLEARFWPGGARSDVWMIVDSARDPGIFSLLLGSYLEYSCLYSGTIPASLETVAPYLARLEYDDRRTREFLVKAWGNSWGIFLKCDTSMQKLRRHLRAFLTVRDPGGNKLLFRYYDPRVLRVYLPACSSADLRTVFGPIQRFWTEGETKGAVLEFGFDGGKLIRNDFPLADPAARPANPIDARPISPGDRQTPGLLGMRREQLAAFSEVEFRKFEDWMVAHLNRFFPRECRAMGEAKLRGTVRYGIQRAAAYGLKAKRDVCKYIDVMIVLGNDFDKDKRHGWAREILGRRADAGARVQTLVSAARLRLGNR
jgi:hypothetical protein